MGDIQDLVSSMNYYDNEQIMIYDRNGTIIGSTNEAYLGGNLGEHLQKKRHRPRQMRKKSFNP